MRFFSAGARAAGMLSMIGIAAACTETLDTSAGCPDLCSNQQGIIETITIDPVVLDTSVSAATGLGTELSMLLASRGDSVDSRAVIRFDSIPERYIKSPTDTPQISVVDSARLRLRVDTVGAKLPGPILVQAYDVNTDAPDSLTSAVAALFTPDRLIASKTFAPADFKDSINIEIPGPAIVARRGQRLRIGLRASGQGSIQFRIFSVEAGGGAQLYFRADKDTTVRPIIMGPSSKTPTNQATIAFSLSDYTLLVKGPPPGPPEALNVGGLPARRVYMRFDVPSFIGDTAQIVRATLLLTQRPDRSGEVGDTVRVLANVSLAAKSVTDIARAAQITAGTTLDTLKISPADSGLKTLEVAQVIALWRSQNPDQTPRALVLVSTTEGQAPIQARFFSIEAAPELRPRLRISYSTRKSRGLP
ncbi:MAG TPA: hypothetical protein VES88_18850 [Gemmatimonadaceae bacterium]|nr:hypothetical protein [Gemmatimonadaceae bacterium]